MAQLWFKFWAKDYLGDGKVRTLTYEQKGILQALWSLAWEEGGIPSDPDQLANMLGIPAKAVRTHSVWICRFFVQSLSDPSKMVSPRLELERAEADSRGSKARESAFRKWEKFYANAHANGDANADENAVHSDMPKPCVLHAGQGQGQKLLTPTPSRGSGKKPRVLAEYPVEMLEATKAYKALMRDCRSEEVQNKFPADKRFLAKSIGSNEDIWKAWQGRTGCLVQGSEVSDRDMLNAILRLINRKGSQAMAGENLAVPMLTTLINSGAFVDALVKVKEARDAS